MSRVESLTTAGIIEKIDEKVESVDIVTSIDTHLGGDATNLVNIVSSKLDSPPTSSVFIDFTLMSDTDPYLGIPGLFEPQSGWWNSPTVVNGILRGSDPDFPAIMELITPSIDVFHFVVEMNSTLGNSDIKFLYTSDSTHFLISINDGSITIAQYIDGVVMLFHEQSLPGISGIIIVDVERTFDGNVRARINIDGIDLADKICAVTVPLVNRNILYPEAAGGIRNLSVLSVNPTISDLITYDRISQDAEHTATYGRIVENVNVVAVSGVTQTIPDVTVSTISHITLTDACVLTFPAPVAGKSFTLVLVQDATGTRLVTWPAEVKWAGAVAPTLSVVVDAVDYLTFVCIDGATWAGFVSGQDIR